MIFKAFEPHDLVGAFAVWADRLRRKLVREWRAEMSPGTPETPETPTPMGWSSTKISIQSTIGAFKLCLKKSSPWPFYWKSGPKRCGHSGLPGTMETWPSLATAATRRGHGCECQSKLGSSCQQGVVMFFQAWSSRTTGAWSKNCWCNLVSFWLLFSKLNPASFMAKHTTETPAHRKPQKLQDSSFTGKLQPRLVPGVAEVCAVYFSFFYKAKPIHFAWRPGIDLEWGHWSESFAADLTCETSVTLALISDKHSSFHVPKCQCTPNKGSVNHCHSSAQIVNLWIQAAFVHHVTCK